MNNIQVIVRKYWKVLICLVVCGLYCGRMFQNYMIDYNVPDFRLYECFYESGYWAKDGFSSLFIWIAHFAVTHPRRLTVFCLLLLTGALFNMLLGICRVFNEDTAKWLLGISFLIVCGSWYYFYGKIFYDFPFSAYTYSIAFLIVVDLLKILNDAEKCDRKRVNIEWQFLMVVLGFMMTWKPYNIFLLVGLWLLAISDSACTKFFWNIFKRPFSLISTVIAFGVGYLLGNYGLLINPSETLNGIRAYAASSDFVDFLLKGKEQIWDHVNCVSFNEGVLNIVTVLIVLFVIPILLKKWNYISISLVIVLAFVLYIYECSPGYLWHGLPLGLFVASYWIFLLRDTDIDTQLWERCLYGLACVAIICQGYNCFALYIPKQDNWFNKTKEAEQVLENNYSEIANEIEQYYMDIVSAGYTVTYDNAVKRYRPCAYGEGVKFVDPLEYQIIVNDPEKAWITDIRESYGTDFVIYVVPDAMIEIDDVTCARKYDEDEVIASTRGDGYEIRLVRSSYKLI